MTVARAALPGPADGDPEAFARRNMRHNVVVLGADFGFFLVGLSFASPSTILPAFAAYLGAPNVVIGAIPALMTLGWFLPSLFAAGYTESLASKLPFILRYTVWERLPFVILALVAFFLARPAPSLALATLLIMLLVLTGTGGVLMPAWMDIVGRAVPTHLRGRFFAVANGVGSVGGIGGSLVTAYVLARIPAPQSFGVCFLGSAVFMALSYAALASVREPAAVGTTSAVPLGDYLGRIPALLGRDDNLSWFLVARACAAGGAMAIGFYTVYALRVHGALPWHIGLFTGVLLAGETVANLLLGWLADRAGHRLVIIAGVGATVAANIVALAAPSLAAFGVVFALAGVNFAAFHVSGLTILLEFAPRVDERPTYVGIGNTALAPMAFAAPLAAGLLADALGFRAVFVAAGALGLAAFALLITRVRDPRHAQASLV